jgi:hypothetical protein
MLQFAGIKSILQTKKTEFPPSIQLFIFHLNHQYIKIISPELVMVSFSFPLMLMTNTGVCFYNSSCNNIYNTSYLMSINQRLLLYFE